MWLGNVGMVLSMMIVLVGCNDTQYDNEKNDSKAIVSNTDQNSRTEMESRELVSASETSMQTGVPMDGAAGQGMMMFMMGNMFMLPGTPGSSYLYVIDFDGIIVSETVF